MPKTVAVDGGVVDGSTKDCLKRLADLAEFELSEAPNAKDPACKIKNPVRLKSILAGNPIRLPGNPVLDCPFALDFARWTIERANALSNQHLNARIKSVLTGPGFVCRRRNNLPTGKLSEHAFGNAIDIASLELDNGIRFPIKQHEEEPAKSFQRALRTASCDHFSTVLGPGSNPAHDFHFHFDQSRGGNKATYRLCE
ncbi:MAG: extensin family protein [Pseudomonadota bacterium]